MVSLVRQFVAGALGAALLAGCSMPASSHASQAAAAPVAEPNTVIIDNFTFSPPTLTVPAGTTVMWVNRDDVPHTVTSSQEPRTLNSPVLDTDGKYSATLTTPGIYSYYCTVHPHMVGTVIVK
jgi:plastocyanin